MRKELILKKGRTIVVSSALALMLAVTGCSQSKDSKPAATEAATEATTEDLIAAKEIAVEDATAAEAAETGKTEAAVEEATKQIVGDEEKPNSNYKEYSDHSTLEEYNDDGTSKVTEHWKDPSPDVDDYNYDQSHTFVMEKDKNGNTTSYSYDGTTVNKEQYDRLKDTLVSSSESGTCTRREIVDGKYTETTFETGNPDKIYEKQIQDQNGNTTRTETTTYDSNGKKEETIIKGKDLKPHNNNNASYEGTQVIKYNEDGTISQETITNDDNGNYVYYEYDSSQNVTKSVIKNSSETTTINYKDGKMSSKTVEKSTGDKSEYTFDSNGKLKYCKDTHPNGSYEEYKYDANGEKKEIVATEAATEATTEEELAVEDATAAEEATKGATEKPAEEAAKGSTEKTAEEAAKGATEKPAEEATKGATEKPVEEATKGATEKPAEETTTPKTDKEIEEDLLNALKYNVGGEIIVPEEEKGQAEAKAANEAKKETEASTEEATKGATEVPTEEAAKGTTEKPAEEAKKGSTEAAKAKQEAKKDKTDNPYQNVDSQGDTFAFAGPDGEFVENPSAPEGYSDSGITKSEDGEYASANEGKKNTSKDTKEASEYIKQVYTKADKTIPELINSDPEQAGKDLYTMITKGLDFLFFGKDFDGYTKDQVDEGTIIYLRGEMLNYASIAKSFEAFGVYTELETTYTEALKYLELSKEDPSIISNLDKIGKEIQKEYSTEEETDASLGTAFTFRA